MSGRLDTCPRFTVIIPCKDRAEYLAHTLRTCSMQQYEPLEIIVSDDGSTDSTRAVVEAASRKDPRIRSITHDRPIGMRDNFEFALQEAKPGFVIMLGSDDGLLPDGITGMRDVLRDTGSELLAWPAPVFTYPGVRGVNGQLAIYNRKGTRLVESKTFLERQSRDLHYLSDLESPMLYIKGVASTRLIDQVRGRSPDRRFYACSTPDGYSGIVLAGEVERYAFSGRPFSLGGLSPSSQGLAYLSNEPEAKKVSAAFFRSAAAVPLHRELASLPYSPLITIMTADYLLRARDLKGWPGRFPEIDYRRLLTNGLAELAHGLYAGERICRELAILNRIADQHGLGHFFRETIRRAHRKPAKAPFAGSGFSPSAFYVDAAAFRIRDIFDAAYAAHNYYELIANGNPRSVLAGFSNSVKYRLASFGRGAPFPQEGEWISIDPAAVS
jgi:glycosyltransferase involved in cell wall biosynthesis